MRSDKLVLGAVLFGVALACCTLSSGDDRGLAVDVGLVAAPLGVTSFTTDLGYTVTLDRGYVAIASVAIVACDGAQAATEPVRGTWWTLASAIAIRDAHAHSGSSQTELGVPGVLPIAPGARVEAELGSILPPPDSYCTTRVSLGPADDDAIMLPDDIAMTGLTLLVEGSWLAPGGGDAVPFRWESTATPASDHATPFELAEEGTRRVRQELGLAVATSFDGIDLATIDPAIGADRVATRFVEDLRVDLR